MTTGHRTTCAIPCFNVVQGNEGRARERSVSLLCSLQFICRCSLKVNQSKLKYGVPGLVVLKYLGRGSKVCCKVERR